MRLEHLSPPVDRRPTRGRTVVLLLALVAAGCTNEATSPPTPHRVAASLVQGQDLHRHILNLRTAGPALALRSAIASEGGTVAADHADAGVLLVGGLSDAAAARIGKRFDVSGIARDVELQWIPPVDPAMQVVEAGPDVAEGIQAAANQSGAAYYNAYQWNMKQIKAIDAQNITTAGSGTTVCILDTGIDPGHLDLIGKVDLSISASFIPAEPYIEDQNFHGSFVSALIASRGIAMASVAPNAKLCALKVLGSSGSGTFGALIDAIIYAATSKARGGAGADVINMSLGAYVDRRDPDARPLIEALNKAIEFAWHHGVLLVAAAGNDGVDLTDIGTVIHIPSELANVMSVGATAPVHQLNFDLLASYSNYGNNDISAPGGDYVPGGLVQDLVLSVCSRYTIGFNCGSGRSYLFGAGTSFASPHVAGAGAVLMSVRRKDGEPDEFDEALRTGADRVGSRAIYGAGRLNVLRAVAAVKH